MYFVGCCIPELHLGFDYATVGNQAFDDSGHDNNGEFLDQSHAMIRFDAPCGRHADLRTGHVQFSSGKLANISDWITIAIWVKVVSVDGTRPILILKGETTDLRFELANGYVHWMYSSKSKSFASFGMISERTVSANLWTHITVQYDAHTEHASLFVNGEEQRRSKTNGGSLELAWGKFTSIGRESSTDGLNSKMTGFVDELYVYFCAIPEQVIRQLAQTCYLDNKCAPRGPGKYVSSVTML